jgi:NADP-dependent 3-hydroxy acid dehydrogenase YdfG
MSAFAGKVVWMTGAGTGIGKAGALMFAREGAAVALLGRRRDTLDEVAAEIQAFGGTAVVEALDVADRSKVDAAAQGLLERLKRVDILVNNAGINVLNRRLDEITTTAGTTFSPSTSPGPSTWCRRPCRPCAPRKTGSSSTSPPPPPSA